MNDDTFTRIGSVAAAAVGALSLLYAIAYLVITPPDQRGSNIDKFFRSYLAHPAGLRIASTCLLLAGLISGVVVVALIGRIGEAAARRSLTFAGILAVVGGFASAAHGLADLTGVDELARRYATGDPATKAAVAVAHVAPSAVDPRGVMTFAAAGVVAVVVGWALRPTHRRQGTLGIVLGIDMVLLFVANAVSVNAMVLVTGGLASVVLGPAWWFSIARLLWPLSQPVPAGTGAEAG